MKILASLQRRLAAPLVLAGLLASSVAAQAQWVWRDSAGNTTFSDSPPPADIKPDAILRRPDGPAPAASAAPAGPVYDTGVADAPAKAAPAANAPAGAKPSNAPKSLAEQDADFRKRRDERAKAEQKEAEDLAKAQQKEAACSQARGYLDMVQSGVRMMRPNPDGTRGYLDDDARAAEVQKAQAQVAQNCG
jgi:hypothetical protein